MKAALPLIGAVLLAVTPATRGASLSYDSTVRQLISGPQSLNADSQLGDWNQSLSIPAAESDSGSSASQRSSFGSGTIHVVSEATGDIFRGASYCIIRFTLDETATCTLTGLLMFAGATGTSCISLVNTGEPGPSIINEIILAPPHAPETRPLHLTRVLPPGSYVLDAMVYAGGDDTPATARVEMFFSIPEPSGLLPAMLAMMLFRRRRRATLSSPSA